MALQSDIILNMDVNHINKQRNKFFCIELDGHHVMNKQDIGQWMIELQTEQQKLVSTSYQNICPDMVTPPTPSVPLPLPPMTKYNISAGFFSFVMTT